MREPASRQRMFSINEFHKLKTQLTKGSLAFGFRLKPGISISISDNTSFGRGWEVRIHVETIQRMCILTEKDGLLTADYRRLVPLPKGDYEFQGYDFQPLSDPNFEQQAQDLFLEAVVCLERRRAEEIEAARLARERLHRLGDDEGFRRRWRELVHLFVPDPERAEKIGAATGRAFAAPDSFLSRLRLPRVTDDLPWLALIAALRKDKLLFEFDWREDPADVAAGVDKLCLQARHAALDWTTLSGEGGLSAAGLLNAASSTLEADGLTLVCLVVGSDGFPTTLLPLTSFEAASSHAATFGWHIKREFA